MKRILFLLAVLVSALSVSAQRSTDRLDRGLVALRPAGSAWKGTYLSWRVLGEEYYGVTYNVYRDGQKLNEAPLTVSNYTDAGVKSTSDYSHQWTVRAVVNGVEQADCAPVKALSDDYLEIVLDHGTMTSHFEPNDACCADVDGDGQIEVLLKLTNVSDAESQYMPEGYQGEYAAIEVYKLNGQKLWWVDLGPNMSDFQNNEQNIVAYDWDGDGRSEALMRAADGTVIHLSDGTEYVVGDRTQNYRNASGSSGQWFINFGREYLVYMDGQTGRPYQVIDYPLPRLEPEEWAELTTKCSYNDYPTLWKNLGNYYDKPSGPLQKAWGDNYGHRSTKHFFGAPCLDGRKPSIFLGRGIYTRHKFVTLDVDPATHELHERWRWSCNDPQSPWYGNGYHNYSIADVDWDGRDEIVFGSMVIDDNGCGLSTTGFGHGDAMHVGDLDPYSHGQEFFGCLEESPVWGNNFRDATTGTVYYKFSGSEDDGRCIMANFTDAFPGCLGTSANDPNMVSSATHGVARSLYGVSGVSQNFRIYWDGDLLDETFNYIKFLQSPKREDTGVQIGKYGKGTIWSKTDVHTNNDTKGTPCYQGDILGDWREELILRSADDKSIRIFTTLTPTAYRLPTLWHDHQYRNAMVWQMCGYNQPPHVSYFLGAAEGITMAPPPLTMTGRTEVANGSTISGSANGVLLLCEPADMTVTVADGASPALLIDNAPSWVQGTDVNGTGGKQPAILRTYYTHTLQGGALAGDMRLVKQGDGTLILPDAVHTYSGPTDVWAGTVRFDGTLQNSRLWLNRFARLEGNGSFLKGLQMDYGSVLSPGGEDRLGQVAADSLLLGFGARVVLDLYGEGCQADRLKPRVIKIEKKTWRNGPKYAAPVLQLVPHFAEGMDKLTPGRYLLAENVLVDGSLENLVIEGITAQEVKPMLDGTDLYLEVVDQRDATTATWTGQGGSQWDYASTLNFRTESKDNDVFVTGDRVVFNDQAKTAAVQVAGEVKPASITFDNSRLAYTLEGEGAIVGSVSVVKNGTALVNINNENTFHGDITVNAGGLLARSMANQTEGKDYGSLGSLDNSIILNGGAIGANESLICGHFIRMASEGGTINVAQGKTFTLERPLLSDDHAPLYKIGTGTLKFFTGNTFGKLLLEQGVVEVPNTGERCFTDSIVMGSGTAVRLNTELPEGDVANDSTTLHVPGNNAALLYLYGAGRYRGVLGGTGRLTFYPQVEGIQLDGKWNEFYGTISVSAANNPTVALTENFRLDNASIDLPSGVTLTNVYGDEVCNPVIGAITGKGTLQGSGTYSLGAGGQDFQFGGTIASPVVKAGRGRWTVAYTAPLNEIESVQVVEGELYLTSNFNFTSQSLGEALVTVSNSGRLVGNSRLHAIRLEQGGELVPGSVTTAQKVGPMAAKTDIEALPGSVVRLQIANAAGGTRSRSYLEAGGNLTLNGTVVVTLAESYVPAAGDEHVLWTASGLFSGMPDVQLPQLPEGLLWDTSRLLAAQGVLAVVRDPTGVALPSVADVTTCRVYNAAGQLVATFRASAQQAEWRSRQLPLSAGTYVVRYGERSCKILVK